jgi:hypothetical protein
MISARQRLTSRQSSVNRNISIPPSHALSIPRRHGRILEKRIPSTRRAHHLQHRDRWEVKEGTRMEYGIALMVILSSFYEQR